MRSYGTKAAAYVHWKGCELCPVPCLLFGLCLFHVNSELLEASYRYFHTQSPRKPQCTDSSQGLKRSFFTVHNSSHNIKRFTPSTLLLFKLWTVVHCEKTSFQALWTVCELYKSWLETPFFMELSALANARFQIFNQNYLENKFAFWRLYSCSLRARGWDGGGWPASEQLGKVVKRGFGKAVPKKKGNIRNKTNGCLQQEQKCADWRGYIQRLVLVNWDLVRRAIVSEGQRFFEPLAPFPRLQKETAYQEFLKVHFIGRGGSLSDWSP